MKQETLEEAAKNISELGEYDRSFESTRKNYFIQGANWQKERMYTEEDIREAIDMARMISHVECVDNDYHKIKYSNDEDAIIEKFKKK